MTFFSKLFVLLFILIYDGTEASTELTNISDPKDITLIVNNKLNCSLVETYFRGIYDQKLIKNHLFTAEYISNCIDYLRKNISLENINSSYIYLPDSLLPQIPKNYQKYNLGDLFIIELLYCIVKMIIIVVRLFLLIRKQHQIIFFIFFHP